MCAGYGFDGGGEVMRAYLHSHTSGAASFITRILTCELHCGLFGGPREFLLLESMSFLVVELETINRKMFDNQESL